MGKYFKFIIFILCIICLSSAKCFAVKVNDYGLYFGSQDQFAGHINYNFFTNLSTCTTYTTPVVINAPLGVPNGSYKSKIIGLNGNKCVVQNLSKDKGGWKPTAEYQIPMTYAKELSTLLMNEIKNPSLRSKHMKEYCSSERNRLTTQACNYLQNGKDKNSYFLHINLGLNKYQTYPYRGNQIPKPGKTMYREKF